MSEIFQIFEIEKYNNPLTKEKSESKRSLGFWEKENDVIRRIITNSVYSLDPSKDICTTIKQSNVYSYIFEDIYEHTTIDIISIKTNQERGAFYPRIYRPILSDELSLIQIDVIKKEDIFSVNNFPINENLLINSIEQLSTLIELLSKTFRVVFPCVENFEVYGFDIRNQLILACTEFENQIVGILKANNIICKKSYYNTSDYVNLNSILKLSEYEVAFTFFPNLPNFSPFISWNKLDPTKSIEWYDNYNHVKHDRDSNFNKGRLLDLMNAISACYIMLFAQYGNNPLINERLKNCLTIKKHPIWASDEKLIKPLIDNNWIETNYKIKN